jgi:hypothetical protein
MFDGDADRLPFAPYTLVTFLVDGSIQDSAATALVVGSFRSPDSHDLLAVGMESPRSDWTQWLAQDIASGQHPPRLLDGGHPEGILPVKVEGDDVRLAVSGATADLDRDGLDEALWLMPEGADSCALLIFGIDVRRGATQQKGVVHFAEPCEDPELASADLDRDGAPDILLLIGEAPRRLQLLWNDGIGRFALENSDAVLTPAAQDVRAFSVFPDLQRIAVVTDGGLHVVSPSAERQFDRVSDVHELNDARAVVVFDPNGDQISEIAVADAEGIRLFEARLE